MNLALAYEAPVALRHDPAPHFNTFLLNVDFASAAGDEWSAIGGGASIPEAITAARDALPAGSTGSSSAGTTSTATESPSQNEDLSSILKRALS
jgi:hypothetical protein